jgi:hypothetical protein
MRNTLETVKSTRLIVRRKEFRLFRLYLLLFARSIDYAQSMYFAVRLLANTCHCLMEDSLDDTAL